MSKLSMWAQFKTRSLGRVSLFLVFFALRAAATTHYVNINNPTPFPPYTSWAIAATDIQSAVNVASSGDLVLVTNGVYNNSGHRYFDPTNQATIMARVMVTNGVTVSSVNGPAYTMIPGSPIFTCVFVSANATLSGFTLTNGQAEGSELLTGLQIAGGAYCQTTSAVITNCLICSNYVANGVAGGVYQGTLNNCILFGNFAPEGNGGGAYSATLNNCILSNNSAFRGGGSYNSVLNNCTLIGNSASQAGPAGVGSAAAGGILNDCLVISNVVTYVEATSGGGAVCSNVLNNCLLVGNDAGPDQTTVGFGSVFTNCTIARNRFTSYSDGIPVVQSCVLRNCILYYNGFNNGTYSSDLKNCCAEPGYNPSIFASDTNGNFSSPPLFINTNSNFHLQPISSCINDGNNAYVSATNDLDGNPRIVGGTVDIGAYEFQTPILYVAVSNATPVTPYTNWTTAAADIQDAVNAALPGDLILVTNGIYNTGVQSAPGNPLNNRVTVTNAMTILSVNGPAQTIIQGTGATNRNQAVRCVYLTTNAVLSGFTLTDGATLPPDLAAFNPACFGGGIYCAGGASVVSNCVITGNSSGNGGGGAAGGTFNNCIITANTSTEGGGAYATILNDCIISNNVAVYGGGVAFGNLTNCLIIANTTNVTGGLGGGSFNGIFYNCTLAGNTGVGALGGYFYNSIIQCNSGGNYTTMEGSPVNMSYCSTTPLLPGTGNFTNAPLFVSSNNFQLQSNSPCINAGNNAYVSSVTDLAGNPRIVGGTVDMGAYEYQTPTSVISYAYLQQYGLPTNGSVDYADLDGTGFSVYQDWAAGLNPTNPASILAMVKPASTINTNGVTVTWQSVTNISYNLLRSTNLPVFTTIQSGITGQTGTTSYQDTSATNNTPYFYRVGVIVP